MFQLRKLCSFRWTPPRRSQIEPGSDRMLGGAAAGERPEEGRTGGARGPGAGAWGRRTGAGGGGRGPGARAGGWAGGRGRGGARGRAGGRGRGPWQGLGRRMGRVWGRGPGRGPGGARDSGPRCLSARAPPAALGLANQAFSPLAPRSPPNSLAASISSWPLLSL